METLNFVFWHWWLFAVVLFIVEMMIPGTFFLWMGVSAILVGGLSWVFPDLGTSTEFIVFAIFSVVSVITWKKYQSKNPPKTDHPTLNRRADQHKGRIIQLTQPIVNGFGKEKVGSTFWMIQGADAESGTKVKITGSDGATLLVEIVIEQN